jgi:hypothetical protein
MGDIPVDGKDFARRNTELFDLDQAPSTGSG